MRPRRNPGTIRQASRAKTALSAQAESKIRRVPKGVQEDGPGPAIRSVVHGDDVQFTERNVVLPAPEVRVALRWPQKLHRPHQRSISRGFHAGVIGMISSPVSPPFRMSPFEVTDESPAVLHAEGAGHRFDHQRASTSVLLGIVRRMADTSGCMEGVTGAGRRCFVSERGSDRRQNHQRNCNHRDELAKGELHLKHHCW